MVNLGSFFLQRSARVRRSTPKKVEKMTVWSLHCGYFTRRDKDIMVSVVIIHSTSMNKKYSHSFLHIFKLEKALPLVYVSNYGCQKEIKSYHSLQTDYKFSIIIKNIPF